MHKVEPLPAAFRRPDEIGGVLDVAVYGDARGAAAEFVAAVEALLSPAHAADAALLRTLGGRPLHERTFLRDWWDADRRSLIRRGDWHTADGRNLHDPPLRTLDGVTILRGGAPLPAPRCPSGQFASAFSCPPDPLTARPRGAGPVQGREMNLGSAMSFRIVICVRIIYVGVR